MLCKYRYSIFETCNNIKVWFFISFKQKQIFILDLVTLRLQCNNIIKLFYLSLNRIFSYWISLPKFGHLLQNFALNSQQNNLNRMEINITSLVTDLCAYVKASSFIRFFDSLINIKSHKHQIKAKKM